MMRGRKGPGRVQAASGHVDEVRRVQVLVSQLRTAGPTELPLHLRRGFVDLRRTAGEAEFGSGEREPRDHGRRGDTPAGLAMADHAVGRIGRGRIADGPTHAAALDVLLQDCPRELGLYINGRRMTPQKKSPALGGAPMSGNGGLVPLLWSVDPSRVPGSTNTLCHQPGFSPTLRAHLFRG